MSFYNSRYATTTKTSVADVSKDVELSSPAEDSISSLSWSSAGNYLATASWDNKVRIYNLSNKPEGEPMAMVDFDMPVLSCSWSPDGKQVVGAGADKTARLLDLTANGAPARQVGGHDAPISSVNFFQGPGNAPLIVTGSWDKTVKYWDLRQDQPLATVDVKDKVYSMDAQKKELIVATAGTTFCAINLDNPTKIHDHPEVTGLKGQLRAVKLFPDATGFVAAATGAKAAVYWSGYQNVAKTFSFKCHREEEENKVMKCYAVNAIDFHPQQGTFVTGGADGTMHVWDKDAKSRVINFPSVGTPITSLAFNHTGDMLAYAVSYDWSKGYAFNTPQNVKKVMIHPVSKEEVQARSRR